jgi:hypothetical protein
MAIDQGCKAKDQSRAGAVHSGTGNEDSLKGLRSSKGLKGLGLKIL